KNIWRFVLAEFIYSLAGYIALAAIALAFFRMLKGPTIADRIISLDAMTIISISLIVFISALAKRIIYMDVAMVYALISFIGVVAVARYLERGF
ncbi:MAG: monovalent cation/H+ antiporter complex subunit F, partial [Candidatus Cloacimonadota bacterium]|nr:monovalent cation/H+ antiporter complex subunit F [Candidatus Cloacimonadota bacterium]